jgi:hypothetical protein
MNFVCINDSQCDFNLSKEFTWLDPYSYLKDDKKYHYPYLKENRLIIKRQKNGIDIQNSCFDIKYWTSENQDIKINLLYRIENEINDDIILSIRPNGRTIFEEPESTKFCLNDLIASTAENFIISLNVTKSNYADALKNFVLKVDPYEETPKFETVSFLNQMKTSSSDEDDQDKDWKKQWKSLSGTVKNIIEFQEESIHFSGFSCSTLNN